jgi:hypothetical protein
MEPRLAYVDAYRRGDIARSNAPRNHGGDADANI